MDTDDHTGNILIESHVRKYHVNTLTIRKIAQSILDDLTLSTFELSIAFVSAAKIKELNHHYREKNKATDVLSFPQTEFAKLPAYGRKIKSQKLSEHSFPPILGDIIICLDQAQKNATHIGQSLDREVAFLIIHGLLHLCGYDHMIPKDEAIMGKQQDLLLQSLTKKSLKQPIWKRCVTLKRHSTRQ